MQAVCNSNALGGNILFARGHGRDYMMRSEKRTGYGSGPSTGGNPRPPKRRRRKAGFFYLLLTLILSVILWPVGMIMLWRRKVRWRITTKLLTSIITLVLCITLYGFGLTVQTDNPTVTKVQDSVNDFLDVSADYVAEGYTLICDKAVEVWNSAVDLGDAAGRAAISYLADGVDLGAEYVGKGKEAVMALLPAEDKTVDTTEEPASSEEPSNSEEPEVTDEPETSIQPINSEEPEITDEPADSTQPVNSEEPLNSEEPQDELPLVVPDVTPDPDSASAIGNGVLSLTGEFTETSDEPINSEEPVITEEPEASTEPLNSEEPVITEEPEASTEPLNSEEPSVDVGSETSDEPLNSEEPEITVEPVNSEEPTNSEEPVNSEEPSEPTATPVIDPDLMPKPAGEAVVYYNSNGVNYHMRSSCKNMRTASAGTLADAVAKGLTKCRNCGTPDGSILEAENAVWVDEEHRFHLSNDCADFSGEWSLMIVDDALAEGNMPCSTCKAGLYVAACGLSIPTPSPEPTAEPTATPEPVVTPEPEPETVKPAMDLKPAGEAIVYHTSNGGWYHTIDNCSRMTGGKPYALADCVENFKRCRKCEAPLPELVDEHCLWMDEESECHTTDDCPGFTGKYTLVIRDDALAAGYVGCVMCGADEYLIPNTIVEYPEN